MGFDARIDHRVREHPDGPLGERAYLNTPASREACGLHRENPDFPQLCIFIDWTGGGGSMQEQMLEKVAQACNRCSEICQSTLRHCLDVGGRYADADLLRSLVECAAACLNTLDFMRGGANWCTESWRRCAVACRRCAASCVEFGGSVMEDCVATCCRCAEACEDMLEYVSIATTRRAPSLGSPSSG